VSQDERPGAKLDLRATRSLTASDWRAVEVALSRMLRLDESAADLAAFHALDPRFKPSGVGRLCRSPSLFEDVIKTVTSCNVTWPGTVQMNRRLCEVLGTRLAPSKRAPKGGIALDAPMFTFPSAARLARTRASLLRARCRVGYRDQRLIDLARLFAKAPARGGLDQARLLDPRTPDAEVERTLIALPGVGPYAAANIMQLLGRYDRLPLDSESVRHGRDVLGLTGTAAQIMKKVGAHFEPMGPQKFRSYWFELREHYERRHGPAHGWSRAETVKLFTAKHLGKPNPAKEPSTPAPRPG
jgi:3-methyladenine DNA glycosylase/8-oxoguanine DNA glycosylase